MNEVQLPLMGPEVKLGDALTRLSGHGASGIVLKAADASHRVVEMGELLRNLREHGDVAMSQVQPELGAEVKAADVTPIGGGGDVVSVRLVDAGLSLRLTTSTILCICPLNPTHAWSADQLSVPGRCNIDGAYMVCQ